MNLIEGKQAQRRETARLVLRAVVLQPEGIARAQDVAALIHKPGSTVSRIVAQLEQQGLLAREGGKRYGRIVATLAGRTAANESSELPDLDGVPVLAAAINRLPTEPHRAFLRLLLSGVIARWQLHRRYQSGWPGFVAMGLTKQGKTLLGGMAARTFGLRQEQVIRLLGLETGRGSLLGRYQPGGGFDTSGLLALPLLVLDEWDKADSGVQQAAGGLLLGTSTFDIEGEAFEARPLVMVTLNSRNVRPESLDRVMPEPFVRRSVVLNTEPLAPLLGDLDLVAHELFSGWSIPPLGLTEPACAMELPDDIRLWLRAQLRQALTDDGWRLCDIEPLVRLTLGRTALMRDASLQTVAAATVADYLSCAATLPGQVRPDWQPPAWQTVEGAVELAPNTVQAELEAAQLVSIEQEAALERFEQEVSLAADREEALGALRGLLEQLPPDQFRHRAALTVALEQLGRTRTRRDFDALIPSVQGIADAAVQWLRSHAVVLYDRGQLVKARAVAVARFTALANGLPREDEEAATLRLVLTDAAADLRKAPDLETLRAIVMDYQGELQRARDLMGEGPRLIAADVRVLPEPDVVRIGGPFGAQAAEDIAWRRAALAAQRESQVVAFAPRPAPPTVKQLAAPLAGSGYFRTGR
jgi:hypothetical protein